MKTNGDVNAPHILKRFRGLLIVSVLMLSIMAMFTGGLVQTVQGLDPHVIRGYVFETNATACPSANVTIYNLNTGENSSGVTSNATGYYAYNLLNMPTGWSYGDTIQVVAENSTGETGTNSTTISLGTVLTTIDVWIGTSAATSGTTFFVLNENLEPLENAYINIKDASGDIVVTKITASTGKASHSLSDGLYTVTVSKTGYDDEVESIRVHGANTFTFILGLEEEDVISTTSWTYYLLIILACIGVIALLAYLAKKY